MDLPIDDINEAVRNAGTKEILTFITASGAVLVAFLAAIVSLLSTVLSPLISVRIANKQIHASIISANRQKWIEVLRETIAELIAIHIVAYHSTNGRTSQRVSTRAYHLQNKILMMTNSEDEDHCRMNSIVHELIMSAPGAKTRSAWEIRDELIAVSQRVLKSEWNRIKQGG